VPSNSQTGVLRDEKHLPRQGDVLYTAFGLAHPHRKSHLPESEQIAQRWHHNPPPSALYFAMKTQGLSKLDKIPMNSRLPTRLSPTGVAETAKELATTV